MKWVIEHIDTIIATLIGGGGVAGWVNERRKKRTDALKSMQQLYDEFIKDAADKFNTMHEEIEQLKKEIHDIDSRWSSKYNALLKKYNGLKSEFETYKKKHE